MIDWLQLNFIALINVIVIDVVLAGDNAIIVGLAASRVAPEIRARVIFWGMAGAVIVWGLASGPQGCWLNVLPQRYMVCACGALESSAKPVRVMKCVNLMSMLPNL